MKCAAVDITIEKEIHFNGNDNDIYDEKKIYARSPSFVYPHERVDIEYEIRIINTQHFNMKINSLTT